jgi:superfamily II DNA or RNA helicase/HKD family nuclease
MTPLSIPSGLYDQLVTDSIERLLSKDSSARRDEQALSDNAVDYIADSLVRQLASLLDDLPGSGADRAERQLALVNELLVWLRLRLQKSADTVETSGQIDLLAPPARVLRAVHRAPSDLMSPELGLAAPWLFTAGKGSPSLLHEIRRELASSDRIDILVSFITVSGVRKLQDVLHHITARSAEAGSPEPTLRILTTTYTGATEVRALDELARLPGCEVRVSLDGRRTRLHAKAWMFHRATGFGSAYIGSANLTGAALTGGLEWTVKLTQRGQSALFMRAEAHFETLWADSEFQRYDAGNPLHREALVAAIERESGGMRGDGRASALTFFDLQPKSYQQEMLEQLIAERANGRLRNLLVAATGTGKTVVAAFDYRATCSQMGGRPRLLFVAHREEILRQALRTYREVLRDPEFGDLLTGAHVPQQMDHLFATIDSIASQDLVRALGAGHWHSVVIDECHRLAAQRFDAFARSIRPAIMLGLTATPERSDGKPLAPYFDHRADGSPAVELRLWQALDLQLLAPFEYFACDDETDFTSVPWDQPGERETLDKLVCANDIRAKLVVKEWMRLASEPARSKALVFCVSVAHAKFMTDWLNRSGLPAACIVGTTPLDERRRAPQRLMSGEVCALVTVDLYNEGVDLPMVDTLLLLRPTQSPVLFQQQLGRGLRLASGKEGCLVLDFVGQHRTGFRFDRLLSGITGLTRRELIDAVEQGFGSLPPGCHIHLQKQTRERVLRSLRTLTMQSWRRMRAELQSYAALRGRSAVHLAEFLRDQALELSDVYRVGQDLSGWTALKREAGLLSCEPGPEEAYFSRRSADLLHVDDLARLQVLCRLPDLLDNREAVDERERQILQMLAYQIDGSNNKKGDAAAFLSRLASHKLVADEWAELGGLLKASSFLSDLPLPGLENVPLSLHARYGIREILTSVGWLTSQRRIPFQAGVLALPQRKTELLFVTLDKSDGYHDRIAYRDYAINAERFHWQSQNSAGPDTPVGRRYLDSGENGWQFQLFVRARKAEPYRACGPVVLEGAEGDRPLSIIWRLSVPLPARLFREFSVLRGA